MIVMLRASALAALLCALPPQGGVPPTGVLHIRVALTDAAQRATPVPHHALLISDNPTSAPPQRVVTALDGTARLALRPGNYTVESDRPVAFEGHAYQWIQTVDIVAGRDVTLELTAANAEVEAVGAASASAPLEADPSSILMQWQDSVVVLWTPATHAAGVVLDTKGLIATSRRAVGDVKSVEVQLSPTVKVTGRIVSPGADPEVAVVAIDPRVLASVRPVPLACGDAGTPVVEGEDLFAIATPLRGGTTMVSGSVRRIDAGVIVADLAVPSDGAGGPVFGTGGQVIGITTAADDRAEGGARRPPRVVRADAVCAAAAEAAARIGTMPAPDGARLPVEPSRPFPVAALTDAAQHRAGSLDPYQISTDDFDVAFITPVQIYGAQYQAEQANRRDRRTGSRMPEASFMRPLMDFGNWSDYLSDFPPVLLVRVTPRLVEGFWTAVARGAARTQGVAIPPIRHFKPGFSRMQAFCGSTEVTPIHPFTLEQRMSDSDAIHEGLYVFDPGAFGPECATVRLVLYSEKAPEKGEARTIDPKIVEQVWQDFEPYRR